MCECGRGKKETYRMHRRLQNHQVGDYDWSRSEAVNKVSHLGVPLRVLYEREYNGSFVKAYILQAR